MGKSISGGRNINAKALGPEVPGVVWVTARGTLWLEQREWVGGNEVDEAKEEQVP